MKVHSIKKRDIVILLLVLFVAGLMRYGQVNVVEYFHDDGMLATMVQEIVQGEAWHWTGIISSVGIPNPPMSLYVLLPAFVVTLDPVGAILFIMGLNVVGVGLVWWLGHRYWGQTVGLVAGLAYALNPWAIFYSRKLWAQDYHTPFILLAIALGFYGFFEGEESGRRRDRQVAQILTLPVLLIGMQIHFAGWFLLPVYAVMVWLGRRHTQRHTLVLSAIVSLMVVLPYGVGLVQTLQADPTRISDAVTRSEAIEGVQLGGDALVYGAYFITGYGLETWVAGEAHQEAMLTLVPPPALWWLLGALWVCGVVWMALHRSMRGLLVLLMVWGIVPFIVFMPNWTPTYPHYFVASLPPMALLIGAGVAWLTRVVPLGATGRMIILLAFAVIIASQGIWWRGAVRFLDETHIDYPNFTTPLSYLLPIRDALRGYDDVVVISHGMAWDRHHESVVWSTLLAGDVACVRTLQGDGYAVQPRGRFAVLVAPDAPADAIDNYYVIEGGVRFHERAGGGFYTLYEHEVAPRWASDFIMLEDVGRYANGVHLLGYGYENGRLTLLWSLPDGRRGQDYQYSAQFFRGNERLAQADRVFWQGQHWCAGDRLLTWVDVALDESADILQVSLYRLGTGVQAGQFFNEDVLDAMGNATGQAVVIPLE